MRIKLLASLACLFAIGFMVSCGKKEETQAAENGVGKEPFKSRFSCEEHWMVSRITNDLRSMATLAGANAKELVQVKEISAHVYSAGDAKIQLSPSCWDLDGYGALIAACGIPAGNASADDEKLREQLLTPTAKNLQSINLDLSRKLADSPADPSLHEQAALLLGAMALRENAGRFIDLRPLLCRSTAHLAFAAALRKGAAPTVSGRLAGIIHLALIGRPIPALEMAGQLPEEEILKRWVRTLTTSITGDFRPLQAAADRTLMESLVLIKAICYHRDADSMRALVENDKELQTMPDWPRILLATNYSVDEGHLAMRFGPQLEVNEIGSIFKVSKKAGLSDYTRAINLPVTSSLVEDGHTAIISNGDWAHYFRRHLFHTVSRIHRFILVGWGVPETAVEWEKEFQPLLAKLPAGELVGPLLANNSSVYMKRMNAVRDFILSQPEVVPPNLWFDYRFKNNGFEPGVTLPAQTGWFRDVTPPETAFDPCNRLHLETATDSNWIDLVTRLHKLNPWDTSLCFELGENTGNNLKSISEASVKIRDFSVLPFNQLVDYGKLSRPELIKTLQDFSKIDPSRGLELGQLLVLDGRDKEAFDVYQQAFDHTTDRVQVSNSTRWLMNYCLTNGMDARAAEIADHNAEVYSASGLTCGLMHAIHLKDLAKSREFAKNILERYGSHDYRPFVEWMLNKDESALRMVFPKGLEKIAATDIDPKSGVAGVRLNQHSEVTDAAGLRAGDVICAVDGCRAGNVAQYEFLMDLSTNTHSDFLVKRGRKILEIHAIVPNRRLGVDIATVK